MVSVIFGRGIGIAPTFVGWPGRFVCSGDYYPEAAGAAIGKEECAGAVTGGFIRTGLGILTVAWPDLMTGACEAAARRSVSSDTTHPFPKSTVRRIAIEAMNQLGNERLKMLEVA